MRTPLIAPAYVASSRNVGYDRLINLYPLLIETRNGKEVGYLRATPGLTLKLSIGTGPIRGGWVAGGSAYVVSGDTVYRIQSNWTWTILGTLSTSTGPVSITDNGTQLLITDGISGYGVTLPGTWVGVVASFPAAANILTYQDGFGLAAVPGTQTFFQSNAADLFTWGGANFGLANGESGNVVSILDVHRELWVFCQNVTEVWVNAGLANFAFQRLNGPFLHMGTNAPFSPAMVGLVPCWLGQNRQGANIAYLAGGYEPIRISTSALEDEWAGYATTADAIGFGYLDRGKHFYILQFPSANKTWVYDMTGSAELRMPLWHERASFANGAFNRHWANCYFQFAGLDVVGDYQNGNLYALDYNNNTDNGSAKKWLRTWRALPPGKQSYEPVRFDHLQIDLETGITPTASGDPLLTLRYSKDGGNRWSSERYAHAGKIGETGRRVVFRRFGSTRRQSGLDMVFELSSADNFRPTLIAAELGAEAA